MKVCSFLPAATQMIYDLGLQDFLYGITFECPERALNEKEVLIECRLDIQGLDSLSIDQQFSEAKKSDLPLYTVNKERLEAIAPDVIFTQELCDVCLIDSDEVASAVAHLSKKPKLIELSPNSLEDVFQNFRTIAEEMNAVEKGVELEKEYRLRLSNLSKSENKKEVLFLEWIEPFYNCGHWIPDQIDLAGGVDMLSNPHGDSFRIPLDMILNYDPEIIFLGCCGYSVERTQQDLDKLNDNPEWQKLQAVQNKKVYVMDYKYFTQSSISTLVEGVEMLSGVFKEDV